jgi:hypothetical protein
MARGISKGNGKTLEGDAYIYYFHGSDEFSDIDFETLQNVHFIYIQFIITPIKQFLK